MQGNVISYTVIKNQGQLIHVRMNVKHSIVGSVQYTDLTDFFQNIFM